MGSITSLVDGSTHNYNELVTVTYDSGAFDFGNGAGQIATLVFEQNGIPKATRSTQPTAAPATYSQSWALPASGATAIIRVHAKNLMGMVLETVEVTLNLDAQPAATCAGATDQAMDALTLNGNIVGIPAGGSAQFRYGTVNGGPYPDTIPAFPQAVGPTSAALTGLTAGTVYYYVLEILDASSTVVATSPQCSGQTLLDANQAGPACPVPPYVDDCPPKQVYSVGGVEYAAYQFCDKATNTPILVIYRLCDGILTGDPTYYDLLGQPYIPSGDVGLCDTGLDYETLCDKGTDPNTRILALWDTSTVPPTLKYYTPGIDGSLTIYVPIGPVGACPETDTEESQICYIATVAGTGYAIGDQLLQILFWDTGENPPTLTATVWRNQTQNTTLSASPPSADMASCGSKDHEFLILCDIAAGTVTKFLRRYSVDATGMVSFTDTQINGTTAYVPAGTVSVCPDQTPETIILCDDNGQFLRRMCASCGAGTPAVQDFALDGTTPYVVQGTVQSCSPAPVSLTEDCYIAIRDGALGSGYTQGDILTKVIAWDASETPPTVLAVSWYNQSTHQSLVTVPISADVEPCAEVRSRDCIPSSDVNLTRTDCAGGAVPVAVLTALSPLSVNLDDADLDGICNDSVSIAPESFPDPFPVNEPSRTSVSGMTLFNNATLTASPAGGNIDPSGSGWLRLTNGVAQRGGAIVTDAFSSTTALEFEFTYSMTNLGAVAMILLDGNQPMPVTLGPGEDSAGYSWSGVLGQASIANGVMAIAIDAANTFGSNVQAGNDPGPHGNRIKIAGSANVAPIGSAQPAALTNVPFPPGQLAIRGATPAQARQNAVKVRGSLNPSGGQIVLNLTMDFGAGYTDVVNNLIVNQALPTNLRIGFTGGTGILGGQQEIRDIIIAPASRRHWRAITPTFADPPACATHLEGKAEVTYVIVADSQAQQGGDNDNEHFVGWALENPVGTYTWLSQRWIKSAPTDVGIERTVSIDTGVLTTAQQSQLRLVLGAETVDLRGEYGLRFNLITTTLTAVGCPAEVIKTIPISAPCPIPVTIVQGTGSGSGVNATVNTVEVQLVCSDLGQIFRREVRDTSGTPKVDFLGQDGQTVSPTTWAPGPCTDCECQRLIQPVCLRDSVTGNTRPGAVIYSFTSAGLIASTSLVNHAGAVITPTATETVTLGGCESTDLLQLMPVCFALVATPTVIHTAYKVVAITPTGTTTLYYYESDTGTIHPVADVLETECLKDYDPLVLCDDNGSFIRHVRYGSEGTVAGTYDTELDGLTAYTPVGDIKSCGASGKTLLPACDRTTETTGNVPGVCGTNQQTADAVDIQDAEEKDPASGLEVNVNDNDLEMAGVAESGESDHQIAVRFMMNVPQGAKVCSAYIQFTSRGSVSYGTLAATISGEDVDASAPFVTNNGELSARTKTTATVSWTVPLWPTSNQSGADQRTPDLSTIVQEIVDRPGWVAGNNTAFFFVPGNSGYRRAQSITSGTAVAPKLHVEYVLDAPGGDSEVCIAFYKEIDLSTGEETGSNYRLNGGAWEAYTPTGTVTDGECLCAGIPGAGDNDFEILCLQDSNNVQFARVVAIDGTSGDYKIVGDYALDFSGQYTPVGSVAPCGDTYTSIDNEVITLCDDNGAFLRHITYDSGGTVQATVDTTLDGMTDYTTVGTIKTCQPEGKPCLTCRS